MVRAAAALAIVAAAGASSILAKCPTSVDGLVAVWAQAPYASAAAACAAKGMALARITNTNFLAAASVAGTCSGALSKTWIGSWYGISYGPGVCLALYTGATPGGGAIAMPVACTEQLPVLCMPVAQAPLIPTGCQAGPYVALPTTMATNAAGAQAACLSLGLGEAAILDVHDPDAEAAVLGCYGGPRDVWTATGAPVVYNATSVALWDGPANNPVWSFETDAAVAAYNYSVVCRFPNCPIAANVVLAQTELREPTTCVVNDLVVVPTFGPYADAASVCTSNLLVPAYLNATEVDSLAPVLADPSCADQQAAPGHVPGAWVAGFDTPKPADACVSYYPGGTYMSSGGVCASRTNPPLCVQIPPL